MLVGPQVCLALPPAATCPPPPHRLTATQLGSLWGFTLVHCCRFTTVTQQPLPQLSASQRPRQPGEQRKE